MRNSVLKSYVFLQSTLLTDRINLISSLPAGFEFDFSKTQLYSNFFQNNLLKKNVFLEKFLLVGNGAFIFSEIFDFEKIKVLKNFLFNSAGLVTYLVTYKSFVFDTNRLEKLSNISSYSVFSKEFLLFQWVFLKNIFFFKKINFILYLCARLIYTFLLRQILLILNDRVSNFSS